MCKLLFKLFVLLALVVCVFCQTSVTPAVPCPGDPTDVEEIRQRITVSPCGKKYCRLEKNTNTTVIFRFKPKNKIKTLINEVYASFSLLDIPFIGVHGQDACPFVTRADTGEPAPCPLEAEQEYIYTNSFLIQLYYPSVSLNVHWSLKQGDKSVLCFEVPATIIGPKKNRRNNEMKN